MSSSEVHIPHTAVRTRTSPGPGSGSGWSPTAKRPGASRMAACMAVCEREKGGAGEREQEEREQPPFPLSPFLKSARLHHPPGGDGGAVGGQAHGVDAGRQRRGVEDDAVVAGGAHAAIEH